MNKEEFMKRVDGLIVQAPPNKRHNLAALLDSASGDNYGGTATPDVLRVRPKATLETAGCPDRECGMAPSCVACSLRPPVH